MFAALILVMTGLAACEHDGGGKDVIQETKLTDSAIINTEPEIPKPTQSLLTGDIINLNNYVFGKDKDTAFLIDIYTVSPDVLSVYLQDAWIEWGPMVPYTEEPGDKISRRGSSDMILKRGGVDVGFFVTDSKSSEYINFFEKRHGAARLDKDIMQTPENWTFFSMDDPNYYTPACPEKIFIKSKPVDWTLGMESGGQAMGYTLYFDMEKPFTEGCAYQILFEETGIAPYKGEFIYDSKSYISEAIHASQAGFSVNDPRKQAFLSLWMGDGGGMKYTDNLIFNLIDEQGEVYYSGNVKLTFPESKEEEFTPDYNKNFNQADVYTMDFTDFKRPGVYKVHIPGIGTSYPFEIANNTWHDIFVTVTRALYHQRSGIALEKPYADFERPRDFHPDENVQVFQSGTSLMEAGGGLNLYGTDTDNFGNLLKGRTDELVQDAWGGYFDAGDWDRRIRHLDVSRLQLEMLMTDWDYFSKINLNIPESGNGLPDLLNEALWNIDFYKRLQMPDGAVRGGIEYDRYPTNGEASWANSNLVMIYAPDHWSGYIYAGAAARLVYVMEKYGIPGGGAYLESALAAFVWSEKEYGRFSSPEIQEKIVESAQNAINDERRMAAIELYRLTGEQKYHEIFMLDFPVKSADSPMFVWLGYDVHEALAVYLTLPEELRDESMFELARAALIREADFCVDYGKKNAFGLVSTERWANLAWGFYSTGNLRSLVRAHNMTGNEDYLKTILGHISFSFGGNAINTSFTTGIGNYVKNALVVDSRNTGRLPPPGITVFGPHDINSNLDHWMYVYHVRNLMYPQLEDWPNVDGFSPIFIFANLTEYTVDGTIGPMMFYLGYLSYQNK